MCLLDNYREREKQNLPQQRNHNVVNDREKFLSHENDYDVSITMETDDF